MTTTYFPLYVSMHASVCMQATCMCTCVSGHTLPCMSVHRYACRYTHELPNASMIVLCIYTHMSAHIAMYGCTHAGTHSVHICSGMHMHRYGARGKTVQHSSPGSFTSPSGDLALSHSCLPGGLFGPLSGGAQVLTLRKWHPPHPPPSTPSRTQQSCYESFH